MPTRRPIITWALLFLTIFFTILTMLSDRFGGQWSQYQILSAMGIVPAHFSPLNLLTYPFFHEGIFHVLINAFYLYVFGAAVEEAVGPWKYLAWYVVSGAVGGALQAFVTFTFLPASANTPIVGASAACAGLVGIFAVRYYRARLSFLGMHYRPHVVAIVAIFLGFEILSGFWHILAGSTAGGIANWAHIGGFIFGLSGAQLFHLGEQGQRAYLSSDAAHAMNKNRPGAAIKRWEMLLAKEPENATARAELARAWLLLGDTEQAINHYQHSISARLEKNERNEAALLYAEMRENNLKPPPQPTGQLFVLGNALEDLEQFDLAAETLRSASTRDPRSPATESALLKVISLYVHHLHRAEEARILLSVFMERFPHSQWNALAEDLKKAVDKM